jgi:transcriptional regulator with XRE-family HTH domain
MTITNLTSDRMVLDELGRRLARSRLDRDITQAQLAAEAGISKTTLERIERGDDVRLNSFLRTLRALGQLDELNRLVPEPLPSPIERVELHGRQRRRAGGRRKPSSETTWRWGDEEPEQ